MADPIIGKISVGDGATFTPAVDNTGVISWTNNKNLPNPASVDIPQAVMDRYQIAPIASPAFTGNPTAPTQAKTDNSTKLATTAYVQAVVADYLALTGGSITGDVDITGDLSVTGTITGNLTGNVTGNVTGTASGNLALSGGTMTGAISFDATGEIGYRSETHESTPNPCKQIIVSSTDIDHWDTDGGAKMSLHTYDSTGTNTKEDGGFTLLASNGTDSKMLRGFPNGDLTWGLNNVLTDGFVGNIVSNTAGDKSVSSGSSVVTTSVSLAKGVWVVTGHMHFDTISGHTYGAGLTTNTWFGYVDDGSAAISPGGSIATLQVTRIFSFASTTTVNLVAYTSGGSATAKNNKITAVRIA